MCLGPQNIRGKWVGVLLLGVLLTTVGCGSSAKKGTVSGSVSYKGEKLKGGRVTFVSANKESFFSDIDENGHYAIPKLPAGDYTICVDTESLRPPNPMVLKGKRPAEAQGPNQGIDWEERMKRYKQIPPIYRTAEQSTLHWTYNGGTEEHDIPLT